MCPVAWAIEITCFAFDESEFQSAAQLQMRLDSLIEAQRLLADDSPLKILVSEETCTKLAQTDHLPIHAKLERVLSRFGLSQYYSTNDVMVLIYDLLNRAKPIEEFVDMMICNYEEDQSTNADCSDYFFSRELYEIFLSSLGLLAAAYKLTPDLSGRVRVACPPARFLEFTDFSGTLIESLPATEHVGPLTERIVLRNSFQEFILSLDDFELWTTSTDRVSAGFALFVGAAKYSLQNGLVADLATLPKIRIGSEFFDSLNDNQAVGTGRFAQSTFESSIKAICLNDGVRFRTGPRQADPQVNRFDGALAWRKHVSRRHEALRLMYWTIGSTIELANVGPKAELHIAEGDGAPSNPLPTF